MVRVSAGELAAILGGELVGDPDTPIVRIAPLEGATADSISFLANPRYRAQLARCAAGCVIVANCGNRSVAGRSMKSSENISLRYSEEGCSLGRSG